MMVQLHKEKCSHCLKNIYTGQPILECTECNQIIHAKCFKKSNYALKNDNFYCSNCKNLVEKKYNPFKILHIEETEIDLNDDFQKMSHTLEKCKQFSVNDFNESFNESFKNFNSSIFLNIDGNKTNFDTFSVELSRLQGKFTIIGLAETNIGPQGSSVYQISGYQGFYQEKSDGKTKGTGVALYIDDTYSATINETFSQVTENIETLFVTIHTNNKTLTVGVLYRPPNGNITSFFNELSTILEILPNKSVHIMGDFNINLHDDNPALHQLEDVMLQAGFAPLISIYTHEKPGCKPTCIDNIFTNDWDTIISSGTLAESVSHHLPTFTFFKYCITNVSADKHIQYYDYCQTNVSNFTCSLEQELLKTQPQSFDEFYSTFNNHLDQACKLKKPKITKRTAINNPWITGGIIASMNTKHKLHSDWKKSSKKKCINGGKCYYKCSSCSCYRCKDSHHKHNKFKDYRRQCKHIINHARNRHYNNKVNECNGDSKKVWGIINELRGKKRKKIKPSFFVNGEHITSRRLIANEFNKYFVSLAPTLNDAYLTTTGLTIQPLKSFSDYLPNSISSNIYLHECDEGEIHEIITELDNGKSSDIPIHIIKNSLSIITPYLVNFFNKFIIDGIFPDKLKIGRISPIYKNENDELFENYRPISTLPIFGKIFEKVIYKRMYNFLTSQGIINENQFGFRKCHSTSHALNFSVNYVENALKSNKHVLGIFIDLSKAFDTLDHQKLLYKLNNYGIRGNALNLLKSYLSNRLQYVSVLNENSDRLPVTYGVPQGSVLGPLLFLIYINDIVHSSTLGTYILFADDTNIFVTASTKKEVYEKANLLLKSVHTYFQCNLLHINRKKCCHIYFSPFKHNTIKSDPLEYMLVIDGLVIKPVTETKFLGITIDDKLSWNIQIDTLNTKLKSTCGRIYRIKQSIPTNIFKEIYHALFESHMAFGISVWDGVSKNKVKPLFLTQKNA